jgi:hypothetical protein
MRENGALVLWAWVEITVDEAPGRHWLLIRRNARTGELAFYRAHAPRPVPLHVLARVAGRRWAVEESFQAGKELAGLDEHQVRRWTSWHRWTVLAMLAHAFLAVTAATERARAALPAALIPLTPTRSDAGSSACSPARSATQPTCCTGRDGNASTKPPHAPATTVAKTAASNDHDPRLE